MTLALLLLATACGQAAAAVIGRQFEYTSLHRIWERVGVPDNARYLRPQLRLTGADLVKVPKPIRLTIKTVLRDIEIPVDADGLFDLPIDPDLLGENPQVWSNIPPTLRRVEVAADLAVVAPGQREFGYRLLGDMRAELSRLVGQQGFLSRMRAPEILGARVHFPPGSGVQTAIVASERGDVTFRSTADGSISLPLDSTWIARDFPVRLSDVPIRIEIELER